MNQSYQTHLSWNTSGLIATITTEVGMVVDALNMLFQAITSSFVAFGLLVTMFFINWKGHLLNIIFSCAYILVFTYKKRLSRNSIKFSKLNEYQFKYLQEGFASIKDIILDRNQKFI